MTDPIDFVIKRMGRDAGLHGESELQNPFILTAAMNQMRGLEITDYTIHLAEVFRQGWIAGIAEREAQLLFNRLKKGTRV